MPSEYIECVDCKQEFEHDEREQSFFADKGFEYFRVLLLHVFVIIHRKKIKRIKYVRN